MRVLGAAARLQQVVFAYPDAASPALDGADLDVREGEFLLVAGPSGSGKSTLLRVLNGLVPHYSGGRLDGRLELFGTDQTGSRPRDVADLVGFVPQDPDSHATADRVFAEVAFAAENLGTDPSRLRAVVEAAIDQLGLGHLRNRRLDTLSGGERQRVAIAAVLAAQPRILVCDEPTSGLDPQSAEDVLAALVRLRDELGLTVVCAEHRLDRVAAFADRVAWLRDGRVELVGAPRDVFASIPFAPPVAVLGRELGWEPLPLTVREGRVFARTLAAADPPDADPPAAPDRGRGEVVVSVRGLRHAYGAAQVLSGVDLDLRAGDLMALVGRNGAGKTTLLRAMVGLAAPSAGRVEVDGRRIRRVEDASRLVSYLPQRPETLLFRDTVEDELVAAAGASAPSWADRLGLTGVLDCHPWAISSGQRLALGLAVVLARPARVYLLDEPTRGLDPAGKQLLAALLREAAGRGAGVLLVTHDVELVAAVAHKVGLMAEGRIVASGGVGDVLGASVLFASQIAKVMDDPRFLVPGDVLAAVGR